jgi:hypothetical protein
MLYLGGWSNFFNYLPSLSQKQDTMDKLKPTGQNLDRVFNFKCGRVRLYLAIALITKNRQLKNENSALATFRLSPVSCRTHRFYKKKDNRNGLLRSTVVERLPYPLRVEGSSPVSVVGTGREEEVKELNDIITLCMLDHAYFLTSGKR